jgi:hypothetical protein
MAILDLISQVHLPSSVNMLPKYLKQILTMGSTYTLEYVLKFMYTPQRSVATNEHGVKKIPLIPALKGMKTI